MSAKLIARLGVVAKRLDNLWLGQSAETVREAATALEAPADMRERAERDAALAEVGRLSEVLRQIAKKDTKSYIQIGNDPNFPGETLYVPGEIAKIAYSALEWMRDRDNRNGSLPAAYRIKIDEALREAAIAASPPLPEGE